MAGGTYILLHNLTSKPVILDVELDELISKDNKNALALDCNPMQTVYNEIILAICSGDKEFCKYHGRDIVISINGKLIPPTSSNADIKAICLAGKINTLQWFTRQRGGFFMEIINFFMGLLKLVLYIPKLILWVMALILWMIKLAFFLVVYALKVFSQDGIFGLVKFITTDILLAPFNLIFSLVKIGFNWLGRNTVQAIWGADNVPEPGEPSDRVITGSGCPGGQKCYKTADGTIPFSVIIATVLCPPVGVFMEYGLTGWLNILICALLTLVFYFPGLIYALILLYC